MSLADIIGQDRVLKVLKRSLESGRIPHAYIFDGISGCGKKTTALAFIQSIFCSSGGCGNCPSCLKIKNLQHPDLVMIVPDGTSIKIDQIRDLQKSFSYNPYEAPKKACIIEDADKMNPAAANSLLKTLEEPPGSALLILTTANIDGMLPTVLSRCQRLQFSPLPQPAIEKMLLEKGLSADRAFAASSLAGGSMEKALLIGQEGLMENRRQTVERILSLSVSNIQALFAAAEEMAKEKEKALDLLQLLQLFFRDVVLLKGGGELEEHEMLPLVRREADRLSLKQSMERSQWVTETLNGILHNVNTRLALDRLFIRLAGR